MGNYIKGTILLFVLLFLTTFGIKNSQTVSITYYFDFLNVSIPLYGLAYVCLLLGFVIGIATGIVKRFQKNRNINELQKEIKAFEKKVSNNMSPADKPIRLISQKTGTQDGTQAAVATNRK
jgi:uncharacterized integral membrane protein